LNTPVYAFCFDVGGTLRFSRRDPVLRLSALSRMKDILAWEGQLDDLESTLAAREACYRAWCRKTLVELSETELWVKYMLPDHPETWVTQNALTLNQMWRGRRTRSLFPEVVEVLHTLSDRGYALAIISNTTSSIEVPELLEKSGLKEIVSCVILSTSFGKRKPDPSLFLSAARQMGLQAENCAYIGNDPTRDLVGARQAGFGPVYLRRKVSGQDEDIDDENGCPQPLEIQPEGYFRSLDELLDLFPACQPHQKNSAQGKDLYAAALSTMWGVDQDMPFQKTFEIGADIGFTRFELNHKVSPAMYEAYDHNLFYIATVHEPCPTKFTYDILKSEDIAISSLDETKRLQSLDMIKRSIDLAIRLGSRSVVIHPGTIVCDRSRDYRLRDLFQAGQRFTPNYQVLLEETIADRQKFVQPHLDMVSKSMQELISFAKGSGVALGLENRYRYYDIPLPDEMALLLDLCREDWYGFQYDVGHAQTLSVLGLVDHFEWLDRFSERMIGVHLHDVCGIIDHQVPGMGDIDFKRIAAYIPIQAQRTLEIGPQVGIDALSQGLKVLADSGCIEKI